MPFLYADHAATAPLRGAALEAMRRCLETCYGNPSSVHEAGQRAAAVLSEARAEIARAFHCAPGEVVFTSGGTEANNQALLSCAYRTPEKRHIVSTAFEHPSVRRVLDRLAAEEGFSVTLLDVHENGIVTAEEVAAALRPDTALVSVMTANNEVGTIQPVAAIGALCRERGVPFHTDAVQAAGQLPVDMAAQKIDLLSVSAHKFGGPKGIGALCARRSVPLRPLILGGGQERGLRAGTENAAAAAGMAAALAEAEATREETARRLIPLRDRLTGGLLAIPGAALNGDASRRLPGNVNVSFDGVDGPTLVLLLDQAGIGASSGSACAAGAAEPSPAILALGRSRALARSSLRLSLGGETTEEEVETIRAAVTAAVARLRAGE